MEMLHQPIFWVELGAIVWINLLVSGDNAVMIALAARSLPPRQQRLAVFWGSAAAVALRVILTVFAVKLHAIRTILLADLVMSIDNVIAVAAAANAAAPTPDLAAMKYTLLVLGLGISIPIVVFGSVMMLGIMSRYPVVIALGAALLGWIAGDIIVTDPAIAPWIGSHAEWLRHWHAAAICGALIVTLIGRWMRRSGKAEA